MELKDFIDHRRIGAVPQIRNFRNKKFIPLLSEYIQSEFSMKENKLSKLKTWYEISDDNATISIYRGELGKDKGVGAYCRLVIIEFYRRMNPRKEYRLRRSFNFCFSISEKNAPKLRKKITVALDEILDSTFPDSWAEYVEKEDLYGY